MKHASETNNASVHIQGSTAQVKSKTIFLSSLKGGKGHPECHSFLALGQVSMDTKPQSHSELTNCAQDLSHQAPSAALTICKGLRPEGC